MEHPIKNKRNPRVNNPEPKDQALTSPQIGSLDGQITRETMEGRRSAFVMERFNIADLCQPYKNRPHSTKRGFSIFQHSIIPTCPAEVTPRRDEGGCPMVFINGKANLVRPELVDQTFHARDMGLQSIR